MRKKYQPSNGTEGCNFIEKWCFNCWRFFSYKNAGMGCQKNIDFKSMNFDIDDKNYPEEWVYIDRVPTCTSFISKDNPPKRKKRNRKLPLIDWLK